MSRDRHKYIVFLMIILVSLVSSYILLQNFELQVRNAELEDKISNIESENSALLRKISEVSSENEALKNRVDELQRIIDMEMNITLFNSTMIVVPANGQKVINLSFNYTGYVEIEALASFNITIAMIQFYEGQYIMQYQDKTVVEGLFIYPVLPGNASVYLINIYPFEVAVILNITHYY